MVKIPDSDQDSKLIVCWIRVCVGPLSLVHHNNGSMVTEFKDYADNWFYLMYFHC